MAAAAATAAERLRSRGEVAVQPARLPGAVIASSVPRATAGLAGGFSTLFGAEVPTPSQTAADV